MLKVAQRLYTVYAGLVFGTLFVISLPLQVCMLLPPLQRYVYVVYLWWSRLFLLFTFIPYRVKGRQNWPKGQPMMFLANHFSYLDIVMMGFIGKPFAFVGKASIAKVPLFGYMYSKFNIMVDRSSLKDRYRAMQQYSKALQQGKNIVIYPEGGIVSTNMPHMAKFKDGPFKVAIDLQVPVVPVTIPYNWIILPDDGRFAMQWHRAQVHFHEPIATKGLTYNDLPALKEQVFNIIDTKLKALNNI